MIVLRQFAKIAGLKYTRRFDLALVLLNRLNYGLLRYWFFFIRMFFFRPRQNVLTFLPILG